MKILAIETSTAACSVALLCDNQSAQTFNIAPKQHNQLLLPIIDQLLKQHDINISQLDALAYSRGPGSFTGIRLAASLTQGLALAHNLPVIPISTLQIYAQTASRQLEQTNIIVCNDARMQAVYWGCYKQNALHIMDPVTEERCSAMTELSPPDYSDWFAVGDGWNSYQEEIPAMLLNKIKYTKEIIYPEAIDMLNIAQLNFKQKLFMTPEEALPVYLREMHYKQTG
jgi:tRNA threonylcarbamoyladenosine biosynthesis protein TsaB